MEVLYLPVPFPPLFIFSPNSIQQQRRKRRQTKKKKKLLSVSVFRIQRARETFSSPTTFFFFNFLLKRGHIFCFKNIFPGITGSQRLRLAGTSGDHLVQPPWSQQGHLEQDPADHVQVVLNICKDRDSTGSLSILWLCLATPVVKKVFYMFKWEFPHFSLCQFHLALSLDTT